jgi:23S rRNA (pseudouridine1915-N3)-methyltransferase
VKLFVAAVGTRLPDWMNAGFAEYAKRMPRELPIELSKSSLSRVTPAKPSRS